MNFKKNDAGFICVNCNKNVSPLGYTSRNHCPHCLHSLHVDILPGDRACECKGTLQPIEIDYNSQKGYIVVHKCKKCGETKRNKTQEDDDYQEILNIMKK